MQEAEWVTDRTTEFESEPGPPFPGGQGAAVSLLGPLFPSVGGGDSEGGRQALHPAQLPLPTLHIGLLRGCLCGLRVVN